MKILVAYYSKSGNTKKVALDVAVKLKADIDEIIDLTDRSGIMGWLRAGRDEYKGYETEIKAKIDPSNYDLVILGTPVWAANTTPAARAYIKKFKSKFKNMAFFITSGNTDPVKPVMFLEKFAGKKSVASEGWTTKDLKKEDSYWEKLESFTQEIKRFVREQK